MTYNKRNSLTLDNVVEEQGREGMDIIGRTLNLSGLYKLLHDTLLITEEVKEVLRRNCEEAAFALKPWPVKIVEKQEDGCICNCKKVVVESEVEEIAAGIDRAITLAQDLREKVKLNVASQKKSLWKNSIEKASASAPASDSCGRKNALRTNVTQKINATKSAGSKSSTVLQTATSVASRKTSVKKQSRTSLASSTTKSKSERNFILENKLNVKKIISLNKSQAGARGFNSTPQTSKRSLPPTALVPELSNLIHKMAQKFTENALVSSDGSKTNNCPLHDGNQFVERTILIDTAEALRHFNVPNEIVKTLRASHVFLKKTDTSNLNVAKKDKAQKSINNFLKEFEAMNTSIQDSSEETSQLINIMQESILLFSNIFIGKLDPTQLNDAQNWITKSKAVLKSYNTENITKDHIIERSTCDFLLTREWMSNGVWNISCMKYFRSFPEAHCIKYNNEKQLLSLYEAMQKLQRTEYLNALIQIILRDVIPTIKSNIDPASAEYARAYKTMFILCQGLNLEVPVLVRTDS